MKEMTIDEFMRYVLTSFPDAVIDENQTGELVVLTGYRVPVKGENKIVRIISYEPY
jgi:hypothetical protein